MYSKSLFKHVPVRDDRMLERYRKLIEHHVKNPHNGLGEDHHILPEALDGEDSPLVRLSHRAHYIAHRMLWKAVGGAMTSAFHFMAHNKRYPDSRITSRVFAVLKEENAKQQTGKKHTAETKKKISESKKGTVVSAESRKKLSEAGKGVKKSAETRKKMSEAQKGRTLSAEHRKKISESQMGEKNHMYGKSPYEKKRKAKTIFKLLNAKTDNNLLQTRT